MGSTKTYNCYFNWQALRSWQLMRHNVQTPSAPLSVTDKRQGETGPEKSVCSLQRSRSDSIWNFKLYPVRVGNLQLLGRFKMQTSKNTSYSGTGRDLGLGGFRNASHFPSPRSCLPTNKTSWNMRTGKWGVFICLFRAYKIYILS